jgi:predicted PurR-regulated permease PerM
MTISPEKQQQMEEISRAIGEALGRLVGGLIASAIIAGLLYAILHYLIGLSVTYLQVFGVWLIIDFVKYFLKNK